MPYDAFSGLDEAPTIAIVVASVEELFQLLIGRILMGHPPILSPFARSCATLETSRPSRAREPASPERRRSPKLARHDIIRVADAHHAAAKRAGDPGDGVGGPLACSRPARLAADLVITRANVWTGNPLQPDAKAVAIIGDRIVDVGSADEIERWRGATTTVIDAEGRRLVPGFNDAHVHFVDGGRQLDNVDLKDADTPAEFARRIGERAKAKPGEWILGGDWDDQRWTPAQLPTRQLIDDATNATPVFVDPLRRPHGARELRRARTSRRHGADARSAGRRDRPRCERRADRRAQGRRDGLVTRVIPKLTPEQRLRAVKRALAHAASLGVTSVQDMNPTYDDIAVYADLANRGELTARIYAAPMETGWYDQAKLGIHRSFGSPWLRLGAVKGYADGSLGSTTAYFFQPYTDAPETRGLLSDEMQHARGRCARA